MSWNFFAADDAPPLTTEYGQRATGFPSPADEHLEARIDLNKLLVPHPIATYFAKYEGNGSFLQKGDLLVIDRSLTPKFKQLVLAIEEGEFVIYRANDLPADVQVWGVITYFIREGQ